MLTMIPPPERVSFFEHRRFLYLLSLVLAVPFIVGLLAVVHSGWHPTGDYAHTALAIRDIPAHSPLIGVAGRFGPFDNQHAHLGPAMAYALWPVTQLFGGSGTALLAATITLHLAALIAAVVVARRIGGIGLALAVAAAGAVLIRALGDQFLLTPWNPWMPVVAFLLFLVLVLGVCVGHLRYGPWAVAVGTFCAQTHISYMILVYGLLSMAVVWTAVRWWRLRNDWHPPMNLGRLAFASTSTLVSMWIPPIYDQLRRTHNFSWVVGRFGHPCDPRWWGTECASSVGLSSASKALATELSLSGAWITGSKHDPVITRPNLLALAITLIAVAAAAYLTYRNRDKVALALLGVSAAATMLGLLSAARILGDFYDYVIRWTWPIAAFSAVGVIYSVWSGVRTERYRTFAQALALAMVCAVSASASVSAVSVAPPYESDSRSVGGLVAQAATKLSPGTPYLLRWHDPAGLGGIGFGLLFELERSGLTVGTDSWTRYAVGQHRVMPEAAAGAILYIVVGDKSIAQFKQRTDEELLASFDPRSPADKIRSDQARAEIETGLRAAGRNDLLDRIDKQFGNAALIAAGPQLSPALNATISVYTDLRLPVALFQVPAGSPAFVP